MTERRFDPTSGEWVTFATHRQHRTYKPADGACPLCPTVPGGPETEIPYPAFEVVVFDNRFPSFSPEPPAPAVESTALYPVAPAGGRCEVVVYSDRHDLTFSDLGVGRIRTIVDVWADRWTILAAEAEVAYVLEFENKGDVVGTTLSHPHGQIYGYPFIPPRPARELQAAARHRAATGRCVECDVVAAEVADGRRLVAAEGDWVAWVPAWARFPYEVHVAPRHHLPALPRVPGGRRDELARILDLVTRTYDALWGFSLPYVMAIHQRPCSPTPEDTSGVPLAGPGDWDDLSHLHIEFEPPNRTATRLKYLAGSELSGGAFLVGVAPEQAAGELRAAAATLTR